MSEKFATFCRWVCQNRLLRVHGDFFRKVYLRIYEYFHYNMKIEPKTFGFLLETVWWGCQNYNLPFQGNKLRQITFGLLWESLRRGCQNYNLRFNRETVMTKSPFVKKVFFYISGRGIKNSWLSDDRVVETAFNVSIGTLRGKDSLKKTCSFFMICGPILKINRFSVGIF